VWAVGSKPCIFLPDDQTPVEKPHGLAPGVCAAASREEGLDSHSRAVDWKATIEDVWKPFSNVSD